MAGVYVEGGKPAGVGVDGGVDANRMRQRRRSPRALGRVAANDRLTAGVRTHRWKRLPAQYGRRLTIQRQAGIQPAVNEDVRLGFVQIAARVFEEVPVLIRDAVQAWRVFSGA